MQPKVPHGGKEDRDLQHVRIAPVQLALSEEVRAG